jgi:hypothetical protein
MSRTTVFQLACSSLVCLGFMTANAEEQSSQPDPNVLKIELVNEAAYKMYEWLDVPVERERATTI